MTNNPLPAALASIKRYDIDVYGNAHEREGGAWMAAVDVLATLPPPADGAVAWGVFYFGGKNDGKLYAHCPTKEQAEKYVGDVHQSNDSITLRVGPLFAAPPADSALLAMLDECVNGEFGLASWTAIHPCDHTPKLIERAHTLLAWRK